VTKQERHKPKDRYDLGGISSLEVSADVPVRRVRVFAIQVDGVVIAAASKDLSARGLCVMCKDTYLAVVLPPL
jgi:hypothetical protein